MSLSFCFEIGPGLLNFNHYQLWGTFHGITNVAQIFVSLSRRMDRQNVFRHILHCTIYCSKYSNNLQKQHFSGPSFH